MLKIYNYWHCRKESIAEAKQCTELETEEQRVSLCPQLGQTQSTILLHNQSSLFMFYFRPNNHCQCFRGIFQLQYRMQNVEYKNPKKSIFEQLDISLFVQLSLSYVCYNKCFLDLKRARLVNWALVAQHDCFAGTTLVKSLQRWIEDCKDSIFCNISFCRKYKMLTNTNGVGDKM